MTNAPSRTAKSGPKKIPPACGRGYFSLADGEGFEPRRRPQSGHLRGHVPSKPARVPAGGGVSTFIIRQYQAPPRSDSDIVEKNTPPASAGGVWYWRMVRDSNPRGPFGPVCLVNRCYRPLSQPSSRYSGVQDPDHARGASLVMLTERSLHSFGHSILTCVLPLRLTIVEGRVPCVPS